MKDKLSRMREKNLHNYAAESLSKHNKFSKLFYLTTKPEEVKQLSQTLEEIGDLLTRLVALQLNKDLVDVKIKKTKEV